MWWLRIFFSEINKRIPGFIMSFLDTEIFKEIRKTKKTYGNVSIAWMQSRFKMSYQEAMELLSEFEESIFVPFRKNGRFAKQK